MFLVILFVENLASSGEDSATVLFPAFVFNTGVKSESPVFERSCYKNKRTPMSLILFSI
jgi:hypothetical protein